MLYIPLVWLGKALVFVTRLRGGGSALPGLVVERLDARFVQRCADSFEDVVLVAGTNGKTTTTKMIRRIFEDNGRSVVNNAAGSNMPRGVISSLLTAMDWRGNIAADTGLFEVDEGFITGVAEALRPQAIVVLNLLRDQLDRYGELDRTAQLISDSLPWAEHAVLNGDDPRVAALGEQANGVIVFGAADDIRARVPSDDALYQGGDAGIGEAADKVVEVVAVNPVDAGQEITVRVEETTYTAHLQMAGVFNAYNGAAALAVAYGFGIDMASAARSLAGVSPAFGRSEHIRIGDKTVTLLLVKNPAGFNQIIDTYLRGEPDAPALLAINDNYADGRDVSWLWDVNMERLSGDKRRLIASGIRAHDMALRLQYAELEAEPIVDCDEALERLVASVPDGGHGFIVPTYTAMRTLRKLLRQYASLEEEEV